MANYGIRGGRVSLMRPVKSEIAALRDRRIALGITQVELAERAGVSHGWLGKIETGKIKQPRAPFLVECVAAALDDIQARGLW